PPEPAGEVVLEGPGHADRMQAAAPVCGVREALVHVDVLAVEMELEPRQLEGGRHPGVPAVGGQGLSREEAVALVSPGQRLVEEAPGQLVRGIPTEPPERLRPEEHRTVRLGTVEVRSE